MVGDDLRQFYDSCMVEVKQNGKFELDIDIRVALMVFMWSLLNGLDVLTDVLSMAFVGSQWFCKFGFMTSDDPPRAVECPSRITLRHL